MNQIQQTNKKKRDGDDIDNREKTKIPEVQ